DFNPVNLRNPKVESISTYLDLRRDPNTDANTVDAMLPSHAAAKQAAEKLAKLPEVARVRWIDDFVPADQEAKLRMVRAAAEKLDPTLAEAKIDPPTDADNIEALNTTAELLTQIAAGKTGPGADAINRLSSLMTELAKAAPERRNQVQTVFVAPLTIALEQIASSLRAQPVT